MEHEDYPLPVGPHVTGRKYLPMVEDTLSKALFPGIHCPHFPLQEPTMQPPRLRTGGRMNFETLLRAASDGALALVGAIRKSDIDRVTTSHRW